MLSSWGFVLLGSPILLAYGVVGRAPWYYYAMLLPYLVAFIYIPVAIGAIVCLWVVHRIPDSRLAVLIGGGVVLLAGGGMDGLVAAGDPERQPAHARLVPRNARPAANLRATPAAKLVAQHRPARRGRRAMAETAFCF